MTSKTTIDDLLMGSLAFKWGYGHLRIFSSIVIGVHIHVITHMFSKVCV
jgi:hypothetical protein